MDIRAHVEETLKVEFETSLFENREPGIPPDAMVRPHHFLSELHAKYGPVVRIDDGMLEGIDFATIGHYDRSKPAFLVLGFQAVFDCMNDPEHFRQGHGGEPIFGDVPLFGDPPEQTPYKSLLMRGLGRPGVRELEQSVIRPVAELLADRMVAKGRGDLVLDYTGIIPVIVISALFDLPPLWSAKFIGQGRAIVEMGYDMSAAYVALGEQRNYFTHLLYERRKSPGTDFLSWLTTAELAKGQPLRTSEIVGLCMMLVSAGTETTSRVLGEMMVALLSDPEQLARLRADRSLVDAAVAETLRWDGPVPVLPRAARMDTSLHGIDVPEDSLLFCCLIEANRDPSRWENPHAFDLERPPQPTMSFGGGAHICAGHLLARAELETGLDVLIERCPGLRLNPEADTPEIRGFSTRAVGSIPYVMG